MTEIIIKRLEGVSSGTGFNITPDECESIAARLRTLEAENALLLEVLRAARELKDRGSGEYKEESEWVPVYMVDLEDLNNLQDTVDACSHIEIGEASRDD